jgi:RNA polymerase subunit RPABC4/transcription elongation factor Spt4
MEGWVVLGGLVAGLWVVLLWLAIIVWTYRDIRTRARDPLLQVLAIFLVLMFFVPGLALYLLVRPQETLEEAYARSLEEEALLREIGEEGACPSCRRFVERDFLVCPFCQTQLKEQCVSCERLLSFTWIACPYCGTARPSMAEAAASMADDEVQTEATRPAGRGRGAARGAGAEVIDVSTAEEGEGAAEMAPY